MKLRKLLSTFLSVAMISTLVSAFSVAHAADAPTLTATTGYEDGCITVTVSYSGFENFVTYSGSRKTNVKGISAMSFKVETDNADLIYDGAETLISGVSAGNDEAILAFAATTTEAYITKTENDVVKFYFIADENAVANFTITEPIIRVGEYVSGTEQTPVDYKDGAVACVNATYGEVAPPAVPSVDVANEVIVKPAVSNPEEANTVGIKATATPANGGTFTKLTANLNNGSKDAAVVVYEGTAIDAVTVFGLNIMQVPADVTITVTSVVAE